MGQEIERKFLINNSDWQGQVEGQLYRQGYIPTIDNRTVRVRIVANTGYLTLKGPALNLVRSEFEYEIPLADAQTMLDTLCEPPLIEKYRYRLPVDDVVWEIDEFVGANEGLLIAEVELTSPDQVVSLPSWIGDEVTGDPKYYNSNLARHPFQQWYRLKAPP